jgi:hypothetical protein
MKLLFRLNRDPWLPSLSHTPSRVPLCRSRYSFVQWANDYQRPTFDDGVDHGISWTGDLGFMFSFWGLGLQIAKFQVVLFRHRSYSSLWISSSFSFFFAVELTTVLEVGCVDSKYTRFFLAKKLLNESFFSPVVHEGEVFVNCQN